MATNPSNPMAPTGASASSMPHSDAAAKALHLTPTQGVPSGPSAAELMLRMEEMQKTINALVDMRMSQEKQEAVVTEEKEYFHQTPGSSIVVSHKGPNGEHIPERIFFDFRGSLVTSDPDVQAFLDPIADRPGVPIYTHKAPAVNPDAEKAAAEVIKAAATSIDKLGSEASRTQA